MYAKQFVAVYCSCGAPTIHTKGRLQCALLTIACTTLITSHLPQARGRPASAASSQAARAAWTRSATTAQRCATSELAQAVAASITAALEHFSPSVSSLCPTTVLQNVSQVRCPSPVQALPDAYGGTANQLGGSTAAQGRATPGAGGGGSSSSAAGNPGISNAAAKNAGPGATASTAGRPDGAPAPGVIYGSGPNRSGVWQRSNSLVSGVAQVPCCFDSMHCMESMPARVATMIILSNSSGCTSASTCACQWRCEPLFNYIMHADNVWRYCSAPATSRMIWAAWRGGPPARPWGRAPRWSAAPPPCCSAPASTPPRAPATWRPPSDRWDHLDVFDVHRRQAECCSGPKRGLC